MLSNKMLYSLFIVSHMGAMETELTPFDFQKKLVISNLSCRLPYYSQLLTEKLTLNKAVEFLWQQYQAKGEPIKSIQEWFSLDQWMYVKTMGDSHLRLLCENIETIATSNQDIKKIDRLIRRVEFFLAALPEDKDQSFFVNETPQASALFINWTLRSLASGFDKHDFKKFFSPYFPLLYFRSNCSKSDYLFYEQLKFLSHIKIENQDDPLVHKILYIQNKIKSLLRFRDYDRVPDDLNQLVMEILLYIKK